MVVSYYRFKVIVLGDTGVGKTVIEDYMGKINPSPFDQLYRAGNKSQRSTIGAGFNYLNLSVKNIEVNLEVWVISADKKFKYLLPSYILSSHGALLLYDITNASSLHRLAEWIPLITKQCGAIPIVLVGNKLDLEAKRSISKEQGIAFQSKHALSSFMEVSMKSGEGVVKLLECIRDLILLVK